MFPENVDVVGRAWDAWLRGDLPTLFGHFHPEIVWDTSHFRDWPESAYHGIEGVERFLTEWLDVWDHYEVGVDDIIPAPDGRVVTLLWHRGKGRSSGLAMDMKMAQIATVRDGKITQLDNYDDRAEALKAAGVELGMARANVNLVRRAWAAFERGDIDTMLEDFHDDVVWKQAEEPRPARGQDEVLAAMQRWVDVWDDPGFEIEEVQELDEDRLLVAYLASGRAKASGLPVEQRFYMVFTVRGGKIASMYEYADRADALEAARAAEL